MPVYDQTEQSNGAPDPLVTGVFERPDSYILQAIARHKGIVLAVIVATALLGVAVGRSRSVTYTASATLQVGQVNPNSPGFYGYVQSATSLATAFSRSVASESVLNAVHDKLGLSPSKALTRLSAAPIPQAPAFRVIATGQTAHGAVTLANVAANAVIAYESQSNNANPEASSLLLEYKRASVRVWHATERIARLVHHSRGPVSKSALARAEAEKSAQAARFRAIGSAYDAAVLSQAPRAGLVSLLAGATNASGNRSSQMELYGFLGLLVGVVAGCVAAVLLDRIRSKRTAVDGELSRSQPA